MTPEVAQAIEEIRAGYPASDVTIKPDSDGGALVIVSPVDPGSPYEQRETWIGFRITFQYPVADVYPHFVRGDLRRIDNVPLGVGTSVTTFDDRPAIQLSRRSNRLNPATDTALLKLQKVLHWLETK